MQRQEEEDTQRTSNGPRHHFLRRLCPRKEELDIRKTEEGRRRRLGGRVKGVRASYTATKGQGIRVSVGRGMSGVGALPTRTGESVLPVYLLSAQNHVAENVVRQRSAVTQPSTAPLQVMSPR